MRLHAISCQRPSCNLYIYEEVVEFFAGVTGIYCRKFWDSKSCSVVLFPVLLTSLLFCNNLFSLTYESFKMITNITFNTRRVDGADGSVFLTQLQVSFLGECNNQWLSHVVGHFSCLPNLIADWSQDVFQSLSFCLVCYTTLQLTALLQCFDCCIHLLSENRVISVSPSLKKGSEEHVKNAKRDTLSSTLFSSITINKGFVPYKWLKLLVLVNRNHLDNEPTHFIQLENEVTPFQMTMKIREGGSSRTEWKILGQDGALPPVTLYGNTSGTLHLVALWAVKHY